MSFRKLTAGQDIKFDAHQAGDRQEIKISDLYLEKRLHKGGKIRFHFWGNKIPVSSGLGESDQVKVIKSFSNTSQKSKKTRDQFAELLSNQLDRFLQGKATLDQARETAKTIARHFGLYEKFVTEVIIFYEAKLAKFITHHLDASTHKAFEISQQVESIEILEPKKVLVAHYSALYKNSENKNNN